MEEKQIIFYKTNNSHVNVSVFFYNETFWLTQKTISELFNIDRSVVAKHIKNISSPHVEKVLYQEASKIRKDYLIPLLLRG